MQERYYMKNITSMDFSGYKFILYYAEVLDDMIAEFPHHHPLYQVYYVLNGSIKINIAGVIHTIGERQACILDKDVKHHVFYEPDVKKDYFSVIFDIVPTSGESFNGPDGVLEYKDILNTLNLLSANGCYTSKPFDEQRIVEELDHEITEKKIGWNTQAVMLCYQFVIHSLRYINEKAASDIKFSGKDNLAMSVSKYIHKHYSEDISVESVAEQLSVSPRHINRAYKAMFSTTFMKNANLLRIAYAKEYLCKTDMSIEQISEDIGFTSPRILYGLFKKYEGIPVSQYRNDHKCKDKKLQIAMLREKC